MRAKKLLSVLLAGAMMMSVLAGCGGGSGKPDIPEDTNIVWDDTSESDDQATHTITLPKDETYEAQFVDSENGIVEAGGEVTFIITATDGNEITSIKIGEKTYNEENPGTTGGQFEFPCKSVQVTLTNVNSAPNIEVTTQKIEYTIKTNVAGVAGTSAVVCNNKGPVYYGEAVTFTVTRANTYEVVGVSATMGGKPVSDLQSQETDKYTTTYTINVTGNIDFTVTFAQSEFDKMKITTDLEDEYKVGSIIDPSVVTAQATHKNGDEVSIPAQDITVTLDEQAKTINVSVQYNEHKYSLEPIPVKVVTLTTEEVQTVTSEFDKQATVYTVLDPDNESDASLITKMKVMESKTTLESGGSLLKWHKTFVKVNIGPSSNAAELKKQIQDFFESHVKTLNYFTQQIKVYMELDGEAGSGTLYVTYTVWD